MKHREKEIHPMSFAHYYVEQRSSKTSLFYNQINLLLDWKKIESVINHILPSWRNPSGRKTL